MKPILLLLVFATSLAHGQLSMDAAKEVQLKYHISSYSYHEQFVGHMGYGAPIILTKDGGAAAFGDSDEGVMLIKLDKTGKELWKRKITPKGEEQETQSVVEDRSGNFYVCILVYGLSDYRGGCERVIFVNKSGTIGWDKMIGSCGQVNNPVIDYMRGLPDGRIELRGHVVTKKPLEGKDPDTQYWEGWLTYQGKLTQKAGAKLDYSNQDWQKLYAPEP